MIDVKTPRLEFYRSVSESRASLCRVRDVGPNVLLEESLSVTLLALSEWNFQTNLQICDEALFKPEQSVIVEDMRRFGFLKWEREPGHALDLCTRAEYGFICL